MDLMLSLSQRCGLEAGLAQRSECVGRTVVCEGGGQFSKDPKLGCGVGFAEKVSPEGANVVLCPKWLEVSRDLPQMTDTGQEESQTGGSSRRGILSECCWLGSWAQCTGD